MGVQPFPDARIHSASQVLPPALKPCQLTVSVYPADSSVDLGLSWAGSHLLLPPMDFVSPLKSGVFGAPSRDIQRVPSMLRDGGCICLSVLKPCDSCSSGHDPLLTHFWFLLPTLLFHLHSSSSSFPHTYSFSFPHFKPLGSSPSSVSCVPISSFPTTLQRWGRW